MTGWTVLTLAGLGHLLGGAFLGLQQLLDTLRLTRHGGCLPSPQRAAAVAAAANVTTSDEAPP